MPLTPADRYVLRRFGQFAVAAAVLAVLVGGVWSRTYWGYWYVFPGVPAAIAEAQAVRYLTPLRADEDTCTLALDPEFDVWWNVRNGYEFPDGRFGRMLAHLHRHGVAVDRAGPDPSLSPARLSAELRARGDVQPGASPQYRYATCLHGGALAVVDARGGESLVVGLRSGEIDNDHYADYEVTLSRVDGAWRVVDTQTTYWDFAGLEGFRWWVVAGLLYLPLLVVTAVGYKVVRVVVRLARWGRQESTVVPVSR
jgi:hypothetical protein